MNEPRRNSGSKPRVALFVTCIVDTLYPDVGMAAVELLERHGATVIFPEAQTCCGQPAHNAGHSKEALATARHFLKVFHPLVRNREIDAIVAPSGSCVAMVKHGYKMLGELHAEPGFLEQVADVSSVTYELTEFLVDQLKVTENRSEFEGTITYHPCCHLLRELGIDEQPRALLSTVDKAKIEPLADQERCCGFGGLFSIKNSKISTAIGRRKVDELQATGADVVAVNDAGCMMHLNGLLEREGAKCRARHMAEILNDGPHSEPQTGRSK